MDFDDNDHVAKAGGHSVEPLILSNEVDFLSTQRAEPKFVQDLPPHLRGPSQNRYGGHEMRRMRGFRGTDYKYYGPGRVLDGEEKQRVIEELKARGEIG